MSRTGTPRQPVTHTARLGLVAFVIATAALGVALAQGADTPADSATALFGSNEWLISSLSTPDGDFELLPDGLAFFKLRSDGALAGTAGCNQMNASFTLGEGQTISFGPVIATRMACPEPEMAQEFAVIDALEHLTEYQVASGDLVLTGGGYQLVLTTRTPGGSASTPAHTRPGPGADVLGHGQAVARYASAFNEAVTAAAAAGADWPADPIRVALAFLELRGAPNTIIARADIGQEAATQTVVSVVEDGFLDDSVTGLEQSVTLELVDGVWNVTSYQGAWLCRRPPGTTMALPGVRVAVPGVCL